MNKPKIGTKPRINPETFWHKVKVVDRKRQIELMKLDNENVPYRQVYTPSFKGTHPRRSIWDIITNGLRQVLP